MTYIAAPASEEGLAEPVAPTLSCMVPPEEGWKSTIASGLITASTTKIPDSTADRSDASSEYVYSLLISEGHRTSRIGASEPDCSVNVIAYLWFPCAETPLAERLVALDDQWCAPLLWRSEFRNVLVGFARRGLITFEGARRTADDAESQMRDREYAVPSDAVIRMAASGPCSAYDCEFVVLAQALGVPLVTAGRQVVKAFPSIAHSLSTYVTRQ